MEGRSGIMPQGEHPFKKGGPDPFDRTTDCLGPKDKERRKKLNDLLEPEIDIAEEDNDDDKPQK